MVLVVLAAALVSAGALASIVVVKGRPFMQGDVFRASRLSRGNHLFPTQVAITPASVVHYTPQWIGKLEQSIHIAHVASVRIDTHLLFSDVYIETSGGTDPITCHGHHKGDAVRMKELIERYQSAYYRASGAGRSAGPDLLTRPAGADRAGGQVRRPAEPVNDLSYTASRPSPRRSATDRRPGRPAGRGSARSCSRRCAPASCAS